LKAKRLYQIDLFRFIAALLVVLFHYTFRGFIANSSILEFPQLGFLFKYGYLGVNLFFLISGFVIYMSIENSNLLDFVKSRIVRLYPAFWVCVSITAFVIYIFGNDVFSISIKQYVANLTMLNGFFNVDNIDGVYWTLLIEIKFYLIISFILFFNTIKTNYMTSFLTGWLIVSYSQFVINYDSLIVLKIIRKILIFNFSSYFIAGIVLFNIFKEGQILKFTPILLACYILSILLAIKEATSLSLIVNTDFSKLVIISSLTTFYGLMFLMSINRLNFLNKSSFLGFGLLTYPLYLIHQNVGFIIFNEYGNLINKYLLLIFALMTMLVISYGINKYVEAPISKKMVKLLNKINFY
jgi:peptidoglycan/LPS O-acetylase OafA/YrhL